jgi:hypothetical protein
MTNHIDEFFNDDFVPNFPPNQSFEYTMIPTQKLEAYKRLLDDTFQLQLNAGDFFYFACAQMLNVVSEDVEWVVEQFSDEGLYSAMAYIQNQEPLPPYITIKFTDAMKVLVDRKQEVFGDIDWDYHGYKEEGPYRTINEEWL